MIDGFVLVQDYAQERHDAVNFRGHGVFAYDAAANCYTLRCWDSIGVAPNVFKDDIKGNTL